MQDKLIIRGAKEHNLKNIDLDLPKGKLIVITGLSGSGKSSLAFDTIYAEGQRRYMESLSSYARQFLDKLDKPDVESIEGLSPAISIDQKAASQNPRSTVGTVTEIYDHLRLLFSSIGKPHCPKCKQEIEKLSIQEMVSHALTKFNNKQVLILAPVIQNKKGEYKSLFDDLIKDGFSRARVNNEIYRLEDVPELEKHKKHSIDIVVDRISVDETNLTRLTESMETALRYAKGLVLVQEHKSENSHLYSEHLSCAKCNISIAEVSPRLFSFNSPVGACKACNGLGEKMDFDPALVISEPEKPVRKCTGKVLNLDDTTYGRLLNKTAKQYGFDWNTPFKQLTTKQQNIVLYGTEKPQPENPYLTEELDDPEYTGIWGEWEGILTNLRRRFKQTYSEGMRFFFRHYMVAKKCHVCDGGRLNPIALHTLVKGKSMQALTGLSVESLSDFFEKTQFSDYEYDISKQVLKEIKERLSFLKNVGLGYLNLARKAGTLSGGEYQRIRLATQIGVGLTGVLYVLDEPSIGLHQRDNLRLIETLKRLRDLGNTLLVVEHDEDTIRQADYVVDIGPAAGRKGGEVIFSGTVNQLLKSKKSLTAAFLTGRESIEIPEKRRTVPKKEQKYLTIKGASEHNLKNLTVNIPLKKLVCVTGVSGSGKSTLINDILHNALMKHFYKSKTVPGKHKEIIGVENIDKLITIDQSPIGRTPRSNPCTYTGAFAPIRELLSKTREARIRGYKPGRFSFNVKGGRCEACEGDGVTKIEMHFLSDVFVTCDVCKGKRYNDQTLEVTYKGFSIFDILSMTVNEAAELFRNVPSIYSKLSTIQDVGLGYLHLGQNATTLSGGEAQRIKLAKELSKRSTGKTLYLLDEPTTGLHFADIKKLLEVLNKLVDAGNSVLVIEHNLDVIKVSDHILDLGPDGGAGGGQLIAQGTPEEIAKNKNSYTGQFLV